MASSECKPFGSWKSPITSDLITSSAIGLDEIRLDGEDVYWSELRPTEAGRVVVVHLNSEGSPEDLTPAPFNVRTRAHEYGGAAFAVSDGILYFSNFADQHLYRRDKDESPEQLTNEESMRYADACIDKSRNRLICIREDHTGTGREALNTIVSIDLTDSSTRVLVSGNDFYSTPRLSKDGSRLSWLTWNHPNMPWDGTELWVADLSKDGIVENPVHVAGGNTESIFQPEWSPQGVLHFVSDRTDWWNLYRLSEGSIQPLCPKEAEFGLPQWIFGMSTYAFAAEGKIVCCYNQDSNWTLAFLDTRSGELETIETAYTSISDVQVSPSTIVFRGGSPAEPAAFVRLDLASGKQTVLRRASELTIDPGYISRPRSVEFPTTGGLTAHALYYPPKNPDFVAPDDERPPLIVKSHGGPTAEASNELNMRVQYWTSRGFSVLDVNYGGSTGYGRAYRERLKGRWGIVDVEDCVNGAKFLVENGEADNDRLAITGGSAGGYTTLSALTFHDIFNAGSSHFGVSDLEALALDTHKFESRYLDGLIGPYPEQRAVYRERSPIHFTDRLSCPLIIFQGLEDKVVPPSQAEMMVEALRKKGLPVAYIAFEGEQHGFRRAENIKRTLDGELDFYARIFGFEPADELEPVLIENLG